MSIIKILLSPKGFYIHDIVLKANTRFFKSSLTILRKNHSTEDLRKAGRKYKLYIRLGYLLRDFSVQNISTHQVFLDGYSIAKLCSDEWKIENKIEKVNLSFWDLNLMQDIMIGSSLKVHLTMILDIFKINFQSLGAFVSITMADFSFQRWMSQHLSPHRLINGVTAISPSGSGI